ncbi:MAG: hypothetical protein JNK75_05690 [Betaproteobacteria bacterium]|nr:hypothetical protein [Betaproteobacteria bacterium]
MNPLKPAQEVLDAVVFPFKALGILALCATINWMTAPGHWWVQWVALGLGIATVVKIARALKVLFIAGALTALAVAAWHWWKRRGARLA